jgi:hypothetical protein
MGQSNGGKGQNKKCFADWRAVYTHKPSKAANSTLRQLNCLLIGPQARKWLANPDFKKTTQLVN